MPNDITAIIITYNEIDNIARTLDALTWVNKVLVVDSFSDDGTVEYCQQQNNVDVIQRKFDNPANQCNFALDQLSGDTWVLSLDADYVLTPELAKEIQNLPDNPDIAGYQCRFSYAINGQILPGSLYPPRTVLYQRQFAHYQQDGHTQRVAIDGNLDTLREKIIHDDRKPHARWLASQYRYAQKEKQKLADLAFTSLSWADKIRCIPGLAPLIMIPYLLLVKGLLFSGKPGLIYLKQRIQAEWILQKTLFTRSTI